MGQNRSKWGKVFLKHITCYFCQLKSQDIPHELILSQLSTFQRTILER